MRTVYAGLLELGNQLVTLSGCNTNLLLTAH
jgi:hypothetical protein